MKLRWPKIPNILNPIFLFKKSVNIYSEIQVYFRYKTGLKQMERDKILGEGKELRKDYINRLFFVINIPPEFLVEEDKTELDRLETEYLKYEIKRFNELFLNYSILDIIEMKTEKIFNEDYYAYIMKIRYKWNETKLSWIIYILSLLSIGVYYLIKYKVFSFLF